MNDSGLVRSIIKSMMHSPVHNYIVPGLTSSLLGEVSEHGTVRVFSCSRDHQEHIAPHSHRYDFCCYVLFGRISNHIWYEHQEGDEFCVVTNIYKDEIGYYEQKEACNKRFRYKTNIYNAGDWYAMRFDQIHSINFNKDSLVLFFQGIERQKESVMLQPLVNNEIVPSGRVQDWMFKRG